MNTSSPSPATLKETPGRSQVSLTPSEGPTRSGRSAGALYELRYTSLFNEGRALAFPCDAQGHVPMDELSCRARRNYLFARALVGRDFAVPEVHACALN